VFEGKNFDEDDMLTVWNVKFKQWMFAIMHEVLEMQSNSVIFYNLLYFIESLQLLYYSLHPQIKNIWTSAALKIFRDFIEMFQLDFALRQGKVNISLAAVLFVIIITTA